MQIASVLSLRPFQFVPFGVFRRRLFGLFIRNCSSRKCVEWPRAASTFFTNISFRQNVVPAKPSLLALHRKVGHLHNLMLPTQCYLGSITWAVLSVTQVVLPRWCYLGGVTQVVLTGKCYLGSNTYVVLPRWCYVGSAIWVVIPVQCYLCRVTQVVLLRWCYLGFS